MTNAGHVEERLGAYLDAELDAQARAAVEAHLHGCSICREELAALRSVHAELLRSEVPSPPEAYWTRFAARLDERLPKREPAPPRWIERALGWFVPSGRVAWVRATAAVASVVLLAYVGWQNREMLLVQRELPLQSSSELKSAPPGESSPSDLQTPGETAAGPPSARADVDLSESTDAAAADKIAKIGVSGPLARQSVGMATRRVPPPPAPSVLEPKQIAAEPDPRVQAPARREPSAEQGASTRQSPRLVQARPEPGVDLGEETPAAQLDAPATPTKAEPQSEWRDSVDGAALKLALVPEHAKGAAQVGTLRENLSRVSDDVRIFVAAALADDVDAAERARQSLTRSNPSATEELLAMSTWSQAAKSGDTGRSVRSAGRRQARQSPAALQALDTLIWPRRNEPGFESAVVQMAGELERISPEFPEQRARARTYLEFLLENATSADERARWQRRLEALAP